MKLSPVEWIGIYLVSLLILGPIRLPQLLRMLRVALRKRRRKDAAKTEPGGSSKDEMK